MSIVPQQNNDSPMPNDTITNLTPMSIVPQQSSGPPMPNNTITNLTPMSIAPQQSNGSAIPLPMMSPAINVVDVTNNSQSTADVNILPKPEPSIVPSNSQHSLTKVVYINNNSSQSSDTSSSSNSNSNNDQSSLIQNIIASLISSSNSTTNSNETSSSSPPSVLKLYPYQSSDQSEIDKLIGKPKDVKKTLAVIPVNVTYHVLEQHPPPPPPIYMTVNYTNYSVSVHNPKRHEILRIPEARMAFYSLSPQQQAQANLAHLTNTELKCYVAPPKKSVVSLDGVIFFWFNFLIYYFQRD